MQEDVWSRLPLCDVLDAEDSPLEPVEKTGQTQGEPHPLVTTTRCHTAWNRYAVERFNDARNGCKFTLENLSILTLELSVPIDAPTQLALDLVVHVGGGSPHKSLNDVSFGERPPKARQNLGLSPNGKALAVNEDAIAIEYDEVKPAHVHERLGGGGPRGCKSVPIRISIV